jgi:hypothetical protein
VRDMMLLSTRLRVWNPDVVVPPSERSPANSKAPQQTAKMSNGSEASPTSNVKDEPC